MRTGSRSRLAATFGVATFAIALVAGCGGSSTPKAPAFNETAAMTQVSTNWVKFFTPGGTTADHLALLQGGSALKAAFEATAANPLARTAKTTVTKVVIDPSHTTAVVTYDIAINGANVVSGGTGEAVLENGVWKVSTTSFCGLANAGSSTGKVPGCT